MVIYNGIDLIEIVRFERALQRHGQRFLSRIFTAQELTDCAGRVASLAARWAAKEAAAKMLGVGLRGLGAGEASPALPWHSIQVGRDPNARPILILHAEAADRAQALALQSVTLSLSHTREHAIASVIGITYAS